MTRKIIYTVTSDTRRVTPSTRQWAGMQYEDNATEIVFEIGALNLTKALCRIDFNSAGAGYDPSGNLLYEDNCLHRTIPKSITQYGGEVQVTAVITVLDGEGNKTGECYSYPVLIYFTAVEKNERVAEDIERNLSEIERDVSELSKQVSDAAEETKNASEQTAKNTEAVTTMHDELKEIYISAAELKAVKEESEEFIEDVETRLANGEFKGDRGEKGEKGDKGEDAVIDQTYNSTSQNAQSGVAVSEAMTIENLTPILITNTNSAKATITLNEPLRKNTLVKLVVYSCVKKDFYFDDTTYIYLEPYTTKYFTITEDCSTVTSNANFELYRVNNPGAVINGNIKTLDNCLHKNGELDYGEMLQGVYVLQDNAWILNNSTSRITTKMIKRMSCSLNVTCDFDSGYRIAIVGYKGTARIKDTGWLDVETTISFPDCDSYTVAVKYVVNDVDQSLDINSETGLLITEDSYFSTVDEQSFEELKTEVKQLKDDNKEISNKISAAHTTALSAFNPFRYKKYYSHLFIDKISADDNIIIPCQSVFDIDIASRLGFTVVEGNVQPTATAGKYVVMHGKNGYLGEQVFAINETVADPSNVKFSTTSFDDIRNNYKYRSAYAKFQTSIISLEEFLCECKKHNIIPFVKYVDDTMLQITKNIVGNDFILYDGTRDVFDGMIYKWGSSSDTKESIIAQCETIGAPMMYGISAPTNFTDDELKEIIREVHNRGCLIGWAGCYCSITVNNRLNNLPLDFSSSAWDIDDFESGNLVNAKGDIEFSDFVTDGTVTNGVLTLSKGNTITVNGLTAQFLAKGIINVKFNGKITVTMGYKFQPTDESGNARQFTSDGKTNLQFGTYFMNEVPTFTITAVNPTEILSIDYKASKC